MVGFVSKTMILKPCSSKTRLDEEFGGANSEWSCFGTKTVILKPCSSKTRLDEKFEGANFERTGSRAQNRDFEALQLQNTAG